MLGFDAATMADVAAVATIAGTGVGVVAYLWPRTPKSFAPDFVGHPGRSRWAWRSRRDMTVLHCLGCLRQFGSLVEPGMVTRWRCKKCERDCVAHIISETKIRIHTEKIGTTTLVQQTLPGGFGIFVHSNDFVEDQDDRPTSEVGRTQITDHVEPAQARIFRRAYAQGLRHLTKVRALVVLAALAAAVAWTAIVSWGTVPTLVQLATRLWVGGLAGYGAARFARWSAERDAYEKAVAAHDTQYALLLERTSSAAALLVHVEAADTWQLIGVYSRGRRRDELGTELLEDICRHADRTGITLSARPIGAGQLGKVGFVPNEQANQVGPPALLRTPKQQPKKKPKKS